MNKLIIKGGQKLSGTITASGSKNATLPIIFASVLGKTASTICNAPHLVDVSTTIRLLSNMGGLMTLDSQGCMHLKTQQLTKLEANYDLVKTMRASILALGPVLSRYGEIKISLPGGCAIGTRPVNLHLEALEKLGAEIVVKQGYIYAKAKRLVGTKIHFDQVSVTATENIIMAATLAKGTTTITNAAKEPEVVDLINFLIKMGAKISGANTDTIQITGVKELSGAQHTVCSDRIEVGTYLIAAAITGGDIRIERVNKDSIEAVISKLEDAGATIDYNDCAISLNMHNKRPKAVDVSTNIFPGFPTDMQAQFMALNAVAQGTSSITETIFENRFMHVPELNRMGANLALRGNSVICRGVDNLYGASVMATDLRASACLVLAGLAAQGTTAIERIYHLDRGYETIEEKLQILGASIQRQTIT